MTDAQYNNNIDNLIMNTAIKGEAIHMCQSAEWGKIALQSSFPRLMDTLTYKEYGEWQIMFYCLFDIFNLQSHLVGINQITCILTNSGYRWKHCVNWLNIKSILQSCN